MRKARTPFVRPGIPAFPVATLTRDVRDMRDERDGPNGEGLVDSPLRMSHRKAKAQVEGLAKLKPQAEAVKTPSRIDRCSTSTSFCR
jgi:hypothetical protein